MTVKWCCSLAAVKEQLLKSEYERLNENKGVADGGRGEEEKHNTQMKLSCQHDLQ